jgi:hypothetical protein
MFHIAHTTIFPNYPGEELETLDREVLVVSADVPSRQRDRWTTHGARERQRHQSCTLSAGVSCSRPGYRSACRQCRPGWWQRRYASPRGSVDGEFPST